MFCVSAFSERMCSYGIKGWKSGSAALKTFGTGCSFIREDEEEVDQPNKTVGCDANVAAPGECGETHTDMMDVVSGMHGPPDQMQRSTSQMPNGKGLFAKDKRRLREKRRSTGIAKLVTEQHVRTTSSLSFILSTLYFTLSV